MGGHLIPGPINPITWWVHLVCTDFHSFPLQEERAGRLFYHPITWSLRVVLQQVPSCIGIENTRSCGKIVKLSWISCLVCLEAQTLIHSSSQISNIAMHCINSKISFNLQNWKKYDFKSNVIRPLRHSAADKQKKKFQCDKKLFRIRNGLQSLRREFLQPADTSFGRKNTCFRHSFICPKQAKYDRRWNHKSVPVSLKTVTVIV